MKYDELYSLHSNFTERDAATGEWKSTFSPPTLDDIANNYEQDARLRDKIQQMLRADDAGKRFYAAVLLWEIDRTKSKDVLEKLTADATSVRVQARIGHPVVETAVGILALDFLSGQQIRVDNFIKEETLSK